MALALIQVRSCTSVFPFATGDAKGLLYMAMTSFEDPCSESTGKCGHFNSQAGSIGHSALSYPQILRRTQERNHLELQVNLLAEDENTKMLLMPQALCEHHKLAIGRDPEIAAMAKRTHLQEVMAERKEALPGE